MTAKQVELELEMVHELEDSYVFTDGDTETVLEKSLVISLDEIEDGTYNVVIPEWLAKDRGLI